MAVKKGDQDKICKKIAALIYFHFPGNLIILIVIDLYIFIAKNQTALNNCEGYVVKLRYVGLSHAFFMREDSCVTLSNLSFFKKTFPIQDL